MHSIRLCAPHLDILTPVPNKAHEHVPDGIPETPPPFTYFSFLSPHS